MKIKGFKIAGANCKTNTSNKDTVFGKGRKKKKKKVNGENGATK